MISPESFRLFVTFIIALFLVLSFKDVFYCLLAYLGVMINMIGLYYPTLGEMRIELLVALFVLLQIFFRKKYIGIKLDLSFNPVTKYMFIFFLAILISFAQAWNYSISWNDYVLEFIKIYIFFIMIILLVETEQQLKTFLLVFCIFTICIGYEGIYNFLNDISTYEFQGIGVAVASQGFSSGHVAAANMQLQGLPIMFYLIKVQKKLIWKILLCIMCCLSVIGIIASGSRGGFLGLIIFAAMIVYFSKKKIRTTLFCIICTIAISPFIGDSYLKWMGSILHYSNEVSANSRINGLTNGIEMMMRRPLLGVGPGCYSLARKAWFGWGLEAHNHYGQLMGDLGLLGTIAWIFFIFGMFINLKLAKAAFLRNEAQGMIYLIVGIQIALIVRLVEGMFSHSLYVFFWYMIAALSIALLKLSEIDNKRIAGEPND